MNILVILRPVRDPAGFTVNRKAQKIFVNRAGFIVNPSDRNALEAALDLAGADGFVTVAALASEPALEALQMARAAGAGRAIQVSVERATALDALGITKVFQDVVAHLGEVDLVLLGADLPDSDLAQVGPRLAAALNWPFVDSIYKASTQADGGLALVVSAEGTYRLLGVNMPAVATVVRDSNKPRFAPAARIITVFSDPNAVENLALPGSGLDAGLAPMTTTRGESFPPERTLGRVIEGEDAVRQLAEFIRKG